jgi:hypothetical protein
MGGEAADGRGGGEERRGKERSSSTITRVDGRLQSMHLRRSLGSCGSCMHLQVHTGQTKGPIEAHDSFSSCTTAPPSFFFDHGTHTMPTFPPPPLAAAQGGGDAALRRRMSTESTDGERGSPKTTEKVSVTTHVKD